MQWHGAKIGSGTRGRHVTQLPTLLQLTVWGSLELLRDVARRELPHSPVGPSRAGLAYRHPHRSISRQCWRMFCESGVVRRSAYIYIYICLVGRWHPPVSCCATVT